MSEAMVNIVVPVNAQGLPLALAVDTKSRQKLEVGEHPDWPTLSEFDGEPVECRYLVGKLGTLTPGRVYVLHGLLLAAAERSAPRAVPFKVDLDGFEEGVGAWSWHFEAEVPAA